MPMTEFDKTQQYVCYLHMGVGSAVMLWGGRSPLRCRPTECLGRGVRGLHCVSHVLFLKNTSAANVIKDY